MASFSANSSEQIPLKLKALVNGVKLKMKEQKKNLKVEITGYVPQEISLLFALLRLRKLDNSSSLKVDLTK